MAESSPGEAAAEACGVFGRSGGWEHGCVGLAGKRRGNLLTLSSSLHFYSGVA